MGTAISSGDLEAGVLVVLILLAHHGLNDLQERGHCVLPWSGYHSWSLHSIGQMDQKGMAGSVWAQ